MSIKAKAAQAALANPVQFAIAAAVVVGVVYFATRAVAKQAAAAVGGVVSGNNAITSGTVYQGAGIVATPAAIANSASGGLLESLGSWLGGKVYDLTHDEYDPNAGMLKAPNTVRQGANATDALWGGIGNVELSAR